MFSCILNKARFLMRGSLYLFAFLHAASPPRPFPKVLQVLPSRWWHQNCELSVNFAGGDIFLACSIVYIVDACKKMKCLWDEQRHGGHLLGRSACIRLFYAPLFLQSYFQKNLIMVLTKTTRILYNAIKDKKRVISIIWVKRAQTVG